MRAVVAAGAGNIAAFDHLLDTVEVADRAGDGDGPRLAEPILFRGLLQQRGEQRVAQVVHRHSEPLLLLSHPHRHPALRGRRSVRHDYTTRRLRLIVSARVGILEMGRGREAI